MDDLVIDETLQQYLMDKVGWVVNFFYTCIQLFYTPPLAPGMWL